MYLCLAPKRATTAPFPAICTTEVPRWRIPNRGIRSAKLDGDYHASMVLAEAGRALTLEARLCARNATDFLIHDTQKGRMTDSFPRASRCEPDLRESTTAHRSERDCGLGGFHSCQPVLFGGWEKRTHDKLGANGRQDFRGLLFPRPFRLQSLQGSVRWACRPNHQKAAQPRCSATIVGASVTSAEGRSAVVGGVWCMVSHMKSEITKWRR